MNNEHDNDELLRRLHALPQQRVPAAHNWQQIQARLGDAPPVVDVNGITATGPRSRRRPRRWRWAFVAAMAACVVLVMGTGLLPLTPAATSGDESVLQLQADSMAGTYQQAMAALPQGALPPELLPALSELDHSAQLIRSAIAQSPEAAFLLGQLQRTYALRLELTRQGLMAPAGLPT